MPGPQAGPFKAEGKEESPPLPQTLPGRGPEECRAWLLPKVAILGTEFGCLTALASGESGGSVLTMLAGLWEAGGGGGGLGGLAGGMAE